MSAVPESCGASALLYGFLAWCERCVLARRVRDGLVRRILGCPALPVFEDEGDLQVDLVASDVAVRDHDVHVLDPGTLHAPKRLGGAVDGPVYGVFEALLGDGA